MSSGCNEEEEEKEEEAYLGHRRGVIRLVKVVQVSQSHFI
jgi:hypothetical protein